MAAQTLANYSSILREVILPYIQDNFPSQKITLNQFKKAADAQVINNNFHVPLRTTRHGGITSLASDSNSLNSNVPGASFGRGSVPVRDHTGAFRLTDLSMKSSSGDRLAIKSSFDEQAQTLVSDFGRDMNRQLYGQNINAVAQVVGSTSGTEFTVTQLNSATADDGRVLDRYGSVNGDITAGEYLFANGIIGIGTAYNSLGTISSVADTTGTIGTVYTTSAGTGAYVANDTVFIADGSGGGTAAMNGIGDALNSQTGTNLYAGVARSTVGWTPQFGSTAEALSLNEMQLKFLQGNKYARTGDKYACFMNITLYNKFGQLLTAMRRTVSATPPELSAGWSGLSFDVGNGMVGVFLDNQVPDVEVVILNLDSWSLCQVQDMSWAEQGADSLLRISQTLTYEAALVWYANVICRAPAANARLTQKTD